MLWAFADSVLEPVVPVAVVPPACARALAKLLPPVVDVPVPVVGDVLLVTEVVAGGENAVWSAASWD
jgi:hypothetical protein